MVNEDEFSDLDKINDRWTRLLLVWLNKCIHPEKTVNELNQVCLEDIPNKYKNDLCLDKHFCAEDVLSYIQLKYPNLGEKSLSNDIKHYMLTSLLLFDCCVNSQHGGVHSDICEHFNKSEQEILLKYCENLYALEKNVCNICNAVTGAIKLYTNASENKPPTSDKQEIDSKSSPLKTSNLVATMSALPLLVKESILPSSLYTSSTSNNTFQEPYGGTKSFKTIEDDTDDCFSASSAKMKHLTSPASSIRKPTYPRYSQIMGFSPSNSAELKHGTIDKETKVHGKNIYKNQHDDKKNVNNCSEGYLNNEESIIRKDYGKNAFLIKPTLQNAESQYYDTENSIFRDTDVFKRSKRSVSISSGVGCNLNDSHEAVDCIQNDLNKKASEKRKDMSAMSVTPAFNDDDMLTSNDSHSVRKILKPSPGYKLKYISDAAIDSPIKHYVKSSSGKKYEVKYPRTKTYDGIEVIDTDKSGTNKTVRVKRKRDEKYNRIVKVSSFGTQYVPKYTIKEQYTEDNGTIHAVIDPENKRELKITIGPYQPELPAVANPIKIPKICPKANQSRENQRSSVVESVMKSLSDLNIIKTTTCNGSSDKDHCTPCRNNSETKTFTPYNQPNKLTRKQFYSPPKNEPVRMVQTPSTFLNDQVKRNEFREYTSSVNNVYPKQMQDAKTSYQNLKIDTVYKTPNSCAPGEVTSRPRPVCEFSGKQREYETYKKKRKRRRGLGIFRSSPRRTLMMIIIGLTAIVVILSSFLAYVLYRLREGHATMDTGLDEVLRTTMPTSAPPAATTNVVELTIPDHIPIQNAIVRPKYVRPSYRLNKDLNDNGFVI